MYFVSGSYLSLEFMQFNPQLTLKILISFNFTPDLGQLGPYRLMPLTKWSLSVNFFNLALN